MSQSIRGSLLEATLNTLSGLFIANLTWVYVVDPIWHFNAGAHDVLAINMIFTVASLLRSFF